MDECGGCPPNSDLPGPLYFPLSREELRRFSLIALINDCERILAVLGVLSALFVISQQLADSPFSYAISFVFLVATGVVFAELRCQFPNPLNLSSDETHIGNRASFHYFHLWNRLGLFAILLDLGFVLFVGYFVERFPSLILIFICLFSLYLYMRFVVTLFAYHARQLFDRFPNRFAGKLVFGLYTVVSFAGFIVWIYAILAILDSYFEDPDSPGLIPVLRSFGAPFRQLPPVIFLAFAVLVMAMFIVYMVADLFFGNRGSKWVVHRIQQMRQNLRKMDAFYRERAESSVSASSDRGEPKDTASVDSLT